MKYFFLTFLVTFCWTIAYTQPANDNFASAIDLTGVMNSCSADAAYTTLNGTGDLNSASCWNNGTPQHNVWFSFVAVTADIEVIIDIGGSKGLQQRTQLALWQSDGTTEIACKRYAGNGDDVGLVNTSLTPTNTYYISVDVFSSAYDGTFTLCIYDIIDYDFREGAIILTDSLSNNSGQWCSPNAEYTTIGGTADLNAGSCWNNGGPQFNRWFSFVAATTTISATVDIGGAQGTQQRTQLALWESDGTTELACNRYSGNGDDVGLVYASLTPTNTYYISVDAFSTSYDGTFSLCVNDVLDYDFREGAIILTDSLSNNSGQWCSPNTEYTTIGGTADLNAGSCWNNGGPQFNRWFSFVAATTTISATVDIGGAQGTQQRTQLALWESDGTTELACKRYSSNGDDVALVKTGLTIGNTYYVSVDAFSTSYDGTFSLCADNILDYDFLEGAINITDSLGNNAGQWCSPDAEYTTIGGTADLNAGSCWNNGGPLFNRWFRFVASRTTFQAIVDIGGSKGSQQRTQLALWESDGSTEIDCDRYSGNGDDVGVVATGLTLGNTYYLSVDAFSTSYDGTFSLCANDKLDYDFKEGAYQITDLNNWCSSDAEFTTVGGSGDLNPGSCWNNGGPLFNRWFTFDAIFTDATITVDIGGSKGTQQRTQLALWESDGTTQVDCQRYISNGDDVTITTTALTAGSTYFISVDAFSTSYDGTFSLCVNNVDDVYYSFANGDWSSGAIWSLVGHSGPAAGSSPGSSDVVEIEDHVITVTSAQACAQINMNVVVAASSLTIDGATLTVNGQLNMTNTGNNQNETIDLINAGSLIIDDNATFIRGGGNSSFSLTMATGTSLSIGQNMIWDGNSGTTMNNLFTLNGTASATIGGGLTLDYSGGQLIKTTLNNTASITVKEDITFISTTDAVTEIELNNTATFTVKKNFVRGTPAYGILDANDASTVVYGGDLYLQIFAEEAGSGTGDDFTYQNVIINNTRVTIPQVTLEGAVSIPGTLTLTDGVVATTASNLLTLVSGSVLSGGSAGSYIDGPIKKIGNTDFTYQIGDGDKWAPLELNNLTGDAATEFTVEYLLATPTNNTTLKSPDPNGDLNNISGAEYWDVSNTGTASNADMTLHWKDQTQSDINDYADLQIAHYDGAEWENLGQSSIVGADPGSITVTGLSTFSPFTFGSQSSTSNPLPVELITFESISQLQSIEINWITATELNNDFFELQKSTDGISFYTIKKMEGKGTSEEINHYNYTDYFPIPGIQYFRLRQVDFDGSYEYSKIISTYFNGPETLRVFPNPLYGNDLNIQYTSILDDITEISIYDLSGAKVMDGLIKELRPGNWVINVSIKPGIYILTMKTSSGIHRERIVKY